MSAAYSRPKGIRIFRNQRTGEFYFSAKSKGRHGSASRAFLLQARDRRQFILSAWASGEVVRTA
ncbi:MAG: hypothetical protein V4696_00850 [Pseudomonadota bacterium]